MDVDAIRTVTVKGESDGLDKLTADVNALSSAQGNLAVVSNTATRAQVSIASALERQQTSLDSTYKAQKIFNQSQLAITTGFNEGLIGVDRFNQLMQLAGQRFDDATKKTTPFEQGVDKIKDKASDLSRELGPLGSVLSAIGPWGLAAAAGIGLLAVAYEEASRTAHLLSAEAVNLEKFSETTGLSTDTLQALTLAAAKHGVAAEDATSAIVRFTSAWAQAREGGGTFLTQLQKINPGLADQVQRTKDSATAFDILTQAIRQADAAGDIAQRNALLRAAGGRGGVSSLTGVSAAVGDAGGLANLTKEAVDAGEAINGKLLKEVQQLQVQIDETKKHADLLFGTIGAESILKSELAWQKMRERIAESATELAKAEEHKPFWQWFFDKLAATSEGGTGFVAEVNKAAAGFDQPALNQRPAYPPQLNTIGLEGPPAAVVPKDISAQLVDLKKQIDLLGSAATANEKLQLRLLELKAAVDANATAEIKLAAARGAAAAQLDATIAIQTAHNAALGGAATVQDAYTAKLQSLQKLQQQGAGLTQDEVNRQLQLTTAQSSGLASINAQNDAEKVKLATIGMGTEAALAYSIAQAEINKQLQQGRAYQDINVDGIRAAAAETARTTVQVNNYTQAMNDAKNAASSFATDFVQGMLQGKSAAEALAASLKSVGSTLASSGIKNLIQGAASADPIQAAIGGVEAVGGAIMEYLGGQSDAQKALQDAQLQWQKMTIDVTNFSLAAKGVNLGPLTQEVQSLLSSYITIQAAALKAHDQAGADQASIDFGNAVNRLVAQFKDGEQTLTPYAQAMKSLNDEAQGLEDTLISLKDYTLANEVGISLQKQLDALAQQFVTSFTQGLQARINTANGQDYLNQIASTISQHQSDILEAQQLGISQSLVDQTFDAEIQKIVNDAGLVGDSFNDFIKQFPQFAGVVTESSTALQAANDKFVQLTKTISDYLNSLALGSNSTLSPQQQLQLAQSNFQQQFALAQGGDQTALGSITNYADQYLNAGKAFFASSGGYSDIFNIVTSALQSLIGGSSSSLGAPIGPSPLFSSTAVSSAVPGVVMPQVSSAANDNSTSQYFQTQTTALSQVFTQVGQAQIVALQSGVADLGKRLDRIANAVEAKGKASRPLQKAAGA